MGDHDYWVNVSGKVKAYHVNLLKKFHQHECERDHISASVEARGIILELVSSAVLKMDGLNVEEAVDNNRLLFLGHCQPSEGFESVKLGKNLTEEQKRQAREVTDEF